MKKQLLFFITLLLAFAPACKQHHKRATLITTGSLITAASVPTGIYASAFTAAAIVGSSASATFGQVIIGALCFPLAIGFGVVTGALIITGVPLIIIGAQMKKDAKPEQPKVSTQVVTVEINIDDICIDEQKLSDLD